MTRGASYKGPDGAERGIVFSQKRPKNDHFESISELSEPSDVGDYKKPEEVSRASPASMSLESLFHDANYGETTAGRG